MNNKYFKIIFGITLLTLGSKGLGFLKESVIAYFYGTTKLVDAYSIAISIPEILFGWIGTISIAFTTTYIGFLQKEDEDKGLRYMNALVFSVSILAIFCFIFFWFFRYEVVKVIARGFDEDSIHLTVTYASIVMLSVLVIGNVKIFEAFLNCKGKYISANVAVLFHGLVQVGFVLSSGIKQKMQLLPIGYFAANVTYFFVLFLYSKKNSFKFTKIKLKENKTLILSTLILALPAFWSNTIMQINAFFDNLIASGLSIGSISALRYSNMLKTFIVMFFTTGMNTILLPELSKMNVKQEKEKIYNMLNQCIEFTLIIFIPLTVGAIGLSDLIVSAVYKRGEFGEASVRITSSVFSMYAIGFLAIGIRDIYTRLFYALKNTKTPLFISILTVILNILLSILLSKKMGVQGVALATSISSIIASPFYIGSARHLFKIEKISRHILTGSKALFSSIFMILCILKIKRLFPHVAGGGIFLLILLLSITAIIIYFSLMWMLKVEGIEYLWDMFRQERNKRKGK